MKKEKEQKKKKIDWKRTFKNNGYMLGLIIKACPGVPILALISTVLGSVHSFLLNTYLYQYALNALQEGKELKIILITLGCMFGYSVLYILFQSIAPQQSDVPAGRLRCLRHNTSGRTEDTYIPVP